MKAIIGIFMVITTVIGFSLYASITSLQMQMEIKEVMDVNEQSIAPILDYTFAYDAIGSNEVLEFEHNGVTITPTFTTVTDADESTGLLVGNIAYSTPNMPPFMLKAISFIYYPESGKIYVAAHDGADESVLYTYLSMLQAVQDTVDLTHYPRPTDPSLYDGSK